ncbi:MoaD/ThiS family protein [Blastomonas sp. AAP53]|uniref:MoaD/ThiS family protein n=1 Tax=Blastomonas sp. AAP53 TaxID=1248760 RepID=UPI0002F94BAB|nr:MoaD/ThiS family protein [Blastomonas sp. AAP53]
MTQLLFFGRLGDLAGGVERTMTLSQPHAIADIIGLLDASDRLLGSALGEPRVRYAINGAIVDADALVEDEDELAFLPPVSGG